jgi:hypothetical protein
MRILYVIFVLCVGALLWAAFAAARHIRTHKGTVGVTPEGKDPLDELPEEIAVRAPAEKTYSD